MARAAYIIKKDGRYWFQKRFAMSHPALPGLRSHCRIALRTSDHRVAVSQMLKVALMVQEFEILPDIASRARVLLGDMQRLNLTMDMDSLVERRTLEKLVSRLVTEARLRGHPLTVDPPDFWPAWMGFVNTNVLLETNEDLRRRPVVRQSMVHPAPVPNPFVEHVHAAPPASAGAPGAAMNPGELGEGSLLSEVGGPIWTKSGSPMAMVEPRKIRAS